MQTPLLSQERRLIEAMLKFANLPDVKSTDSVRAPFLIEGYNEVLQRGTVAEYAKLHEWLRKMLGRMTRESQRNKIAAEIGPLLTEKVRRSPVLDVTGGHRLLRDHYVINNIEAGCLLALALLLDEERGITNRLGQCVLPACERWNVDFEPRGRPRKSCKGHRELYQRQLGAERIWRYRYKSRYGEYPPDEEVKVYRAKARRRTQVKNVRN